MLHVMAFFKVLRSLFSITCRQKQAILSPKGERKPSKARSETQWHKDQRHVNRDLQLGLESGQTFSHEFNKKQVEWMQVHRCTGPLTLWRLSWHLWPLSLLQAFRGQFPPWLKRLCAFLNWLFQSQETETWRESTHYYGLESKLMVPAKERGEGMSWEPHLVQLPVKLCRAEGICLVEVFPQEEDEAAVVHIQGVVMPVHFWKAEMGLGHERICFHPKSLALCGEAV